MENEKIFKPEQLAEEVKKMPPEQAAMLWAYAQGLMAGRHESKAEPA